jgi:hypothetical protein
MWIAERFRICGVKCGHEKIFKGGSTTKEWVPFVDKVLGEGCDFDGDSSWYAALHLLKGDSAGVEVVLHQTRNPLHVLRSFGNGSSLPRHAVEILGFTSPDAFKRLVDYYVLWNFFAERLKETYEYHRYKVEDTVENPHMARQLLTWIGAPEPEEEKLFWKYTPRAKYREPLLSWEDLDHLPELLEMAERYGYR